MAIHTVELVMGNNTRQVEVNLDFDPLTNAYEVRDLIRELVWQHGAEFQPIEDDEFCPGWSRFTINISPPGEGE
jgi:hypothetical protein